MPVVVGGGGTVGEVTSTEDQDVVSTSERVGEDGTGPLKGGVREVTRQSRQRSLLLTYLADVAYSSATGETHEEDVTVMTGSLLGRRPVKVPLFELFDIRDLSGEGHGLASHTTGTIDPDVCERASASEAKRSVEKSSGSVRGCRADGRKTITHTRP